MKIGIISINAHTKVLNFASPLHTYVFQQFLLENGIESTIIDYKPCYYGNFDVRHPLFYYIDHPNKNKKKQSELLKKWKNLFYEREYRFDRFEEFIDKYYIKTSKCYSAESIETDDPGFDCYLCVTDVIWKYNPNNGFDRGFFLAADTLKGKKKIAYAASRGAKSYTYEQTKQFLEYIGDFDYISVREKSLQSFIADTSGLEVPHVIDPVFLMDKDFYEKLAIRPEEKGYILLYIVMEKTPELAKAAVEFAKLHNLSIIELSENPENAQYAEGVDYKFIYDLGVEEWLGYMLNASYVFTNSFHACCFSIIFEKQFFAGARSGDKIDSVLELFNLSWRRILVSEDNMSPEEMDDIVFDEVKSLLEKYRSDSASFILNAIHDVEARDHQPLLSAAVEPMAAPESPIYVQPAPPKVEKKNNKSFFARLKRICSRILKKCKKIVSC